MIAWFSLWAGVLSVQADLITDDFNRSAGHIVFGTLGTTVWTNMQGYGSWGITNGVVTVRTGGTVGNLVVVNTGLQTVSGNGTNFTLSADILTHTTLAWGGIVFNYQSTSNFYTLRYRPDSTAANAIQISKYANGGITRYSTLAAGNYLSSGTSYTFEISSTNAYEFTANIYEAGSTDVKFTLSAKDTGSSFVGGYAGFLQVDAGNDIFQYDNFRLEVIPEPATLGLLGGGTLALLLMRRVWGRK